MNSEKQIKPTNQETLRKSIKTMGDFIKAYDDGLIESDCGWDDVYIDNPGITKDTPVVLRDGEVRICNMWTIGEYNG